MHGLPLMTPSLLLRHFVPDDAQDLMRLNAEPSTRRWLPTHVYANPDDAAAAVAYLIAQYASSGDPRRGPYVVGVVRRQDQQLLGHVGFSPLRDGVEVSYAIAEQARGQGHGTEVLTRACACAAAAFGLRDIAALTASANVASRRTLERSGFVSTGTETLRFRGVEQSVSTYRRTP